MCNMYIIYNLVVFFHLKINGVNKCMCRAEIVMLDFTVRMCHTYKASEGLLQSRSVRCC